MPPSSEPVVASPLPRTMRVALEGEIGVGKSTLVKNMVTAFPNEMVPLEEEPNQLLLKLFYNDRQKYGFATQLFMLLRRIHQHKLLQLRSSDLAKEPRCHLWDRSMLGDLVFCLLNRLLGAIDGDEFATYMSEFGAPLNQLAQHPFLRSLDLLVLLWDDPIKCKVRVEQCRGNASESSIPLSYYKGIEDVHFALFWLLWAQGCSTRMTVWPFGSYDSASQVRSRMLRLSDPAIDSVNVGPTVRFLTTEQIHQEFGLSEELKRELANEPRCITRTNNGTAAAEPTVILAKMFVQSSTRTVEQLRNKRWKNLIGDSLECQAVLKEDLQLPSEFKFFTNSFKKFVLSSLCDGKSIVVEH